MQLALGGDEAASALFSIALNDEDDAFAETACLDTLDSEDATLRGAAVGALGEMAFAGRMIDFTAAELRLLQVQERHPELAGRVEDALEDIAQARKRGTQVGGAEK